MRSGANPLGGIIQNVLENLELGDVVRLRKAHPCGGTDWQVVRLGADIGLECLTCGHRIMLDRRALKNRLKKTIRKGSENDPENG